MWIFVLYLFVALQVAALVGGIVTRRWPLRPQQLVWRGTSVEFASTQIQALLYDTADVRFAYPTGHFVPVQEETNHAAGKVVMREDNFKGSKGLGVVFRLFAGCAAAGREMVRESAFIGGMGTILLFWLAAVLAAPFLVASLIDVVYRALYRSRIVAEVRAHPEIPDAVTVDLTFRGLSSFGIVGDVLRAAATPAPPAGSRAAEEAKTEVATSSRARASQWAGAAERRSSIVYGSGVAASVLVALVLSLVVDPSGSDDFSYSGGDYTEASSSSSSPSDETGSPGGSEVPDDEGVSGGSGDPGEEVDEGAVDPDTYTSEGGGYSVVVPDGWLQNADEKYHPGKGAFYESKWHKPGDGDVYALVDYTPGFSGTPLEGAQPVRRTHSRRDGYVELDFSADGDARRYEFLEEGKHKLDVFHKCGTTGVAVLVVAPADRWEEEAPVLTEFVDSFTCGTADSAAAPAEEPVDEEEPEDVNAGQVYATTTTSGLLELVIRRHWQARLDGDYAKAHGYYTGAVRKRVGSLAGWSEQLREDGLTNVEFQGFRSLGISGDIGRMEASIRTESRAGGCTDWTFTYTMKHSDRWRIANSTADPDAC